MNISVVIPAYNQDEYLEAAIESAYNQTYPAHEIIVVNDGSTDTTQEIAERYMFKQFPEMESPVKVILQVNKGLPSARNTGIMNATGDYVFFLDADDIMEEHCLEKLHATISQTNADIIAPSFRCFGLSDQVVILSIPTMEDFKQANRLGYFCAIRRAALLEIGGYSPKMRYGWEDYHLWFNLFTRGKTLAIIQEPLVKYRIKEHSMIHDANAHGEELLAQIKKDFPFLWTQ